jgi:hypothetical protein
VLRQGAYLQAAVALRVLEASVDSTVEYPNGFVIVSQTCDIARADRPGVQVAPLTVFDQSAIGVKGNGKSPRYLEVDPAQPEVYADLDRITTVEREGLVELEASMAEAELSHERKLRQSIARKFGRIAMPTHVEVAFKPLREYAMKRSKVEGTQEYDMLERIREIRVSLDQWDETSSKTIAVYLILDPGELPMDTDVEPSDDLATTVAAALQSNTPQTAMVSLASLLAGVDPGSVDSHLVWEGVASNVRAMVDTGSADGEPAIVSVDVRVTTKLDFKMVDYEATERLDLAHLSGIDD